MRSEDMIVQNVELAGKSYVILPRAEFDRLTTLAKAAELPALPKLNARGNYPAVEYVRASLARKVIRDRVAAGLSHRNLAKLAGIRVETLCRIETGKNTPTVPTIDRIDRALKAATKRNRKNAPVK